MIYKILLIIMLKVKKLDFYKLIIIILIRMKNLNKRNRTK